MKLGKLLDLALPFIVRQAEAAIERRKAAREKKRAEKEG